MYDDVLDFSVLSKLSVQVFFFDVGGHPANPHTLGRGGAPEPQFHNARARVSQHVSVAGADGFAHAGHVGILNAGVATLGLHVHLKDLAEGRKLVMNLFLVATAAARADGGGGV